MFRVAWNANMEKTEDDRGSLRFSLPPVPVRLLFKISRVRALRQQLTTTKQKKADSVHSWQGRKGRRNSRTTTTLSVRILFPPGGDPFLTDSPLSHHPLECYRSRRLKKKITRIYFRQLRVFLVFYLMIAIFWRWRCYSFQFSYQIIFTLCVWRFSYIRQQTPLWFLEGGLNRGIGIDWNSSTAIPHPVNRDSWSNKEPKRINEKINVNDLQ